LTLTLIFFYFSDKTIRCNSTHFRCQQQSTCVY